MKKLLLALAVIGLFLTVFSLSFSRAIRADSNHDEHQFVASGEVLAGHGLIPYRDYAYFHLPNLIFVYALLYRFTEYKLLAARLFSVLCITGVAGMLYIFSLDVFKKLSSTTGHWVGAGAALLFVANPLVAYIGSFAWNHNLSMLLAISAFMLYWQGARRKRMGRWIFASGICLGLAIGTRLSFAFALVPFVTGLYFYPGTDTARVILRYLRLFGAGLLVSLVPVLLLFVMAPQAFIFGNFSYARLNTIYRDEVGFFGPSNPMTVMEKLGYFWDFVLPQPGHMLTFIALLALGLTPLLVELWRRKGNMFEPLLLSLFVPFVSWGALLPTPAWYQYYAAPIPFAILGVVYGLATLAHRHPSAKGWLLALFLQIVVIASLYQLGDYRRMTFLLHPEAWRPLMMHELGVRVAELGGRADVLTMAPIYPLEGGGNIYPEFITGPFAWRTAPFVDPERRDALGLVSEQELGRVLDGHPPGVILVGYEGELEQAFIDYALMHSYRWVELDQEVGVWLSPELTLP
jgi:4-amino-4-deoxy-L-arabinose transferase-like glycosyltransferase